jgi:hypothetical protein
MVVTLCVAEVDAGKKETSSQVEPYTPDIDSERCGRH